jgi:phosphoribosylglycinamide formyltransferase-1
VKLGVLISGRGSNLQALMAATARDDYPAEIALVVSNQPQAAGLERARDAGLATAAFDHRDFADRQGFEAEIDASLRGAGVELVCLAGFMRLLTAGFLEGWPDRVVNIHPSLLPAFPGIHVHEQVVASGTRFSGCTVHFVRPEMDAGQIIIQSLVPVRPGDDADTLAARVLATEHQCYPKAVKWIAEGRVRINGDLVEVDGAGTPQMAAINPI